MLLLLPDNSLLQLSEDYAMFEAHGEGTVLPECRADLAAKSLTKSLVCPRYIKMPICTIKNFHLVRNLVIAFSKSVF